jgi:predicted nucleic acid-binding protein
VADLFFLDSNVLIYAISKHQDDVEKNAEANRILQEDNIAISTQVMQEFFVNATVKGGMSDREARDWLDALVEFPCIHNSRDLIFVAIDHKIRYTINYYDAAIIAAAEQAGATVVYTEDLNHGQKYGRVTVMNPFKKIEH